MTLVHILNGEWEMLWTVTIEVNSINRLRNVLIVRVQQYSLRKENIVDEFFANLVFDFAGNFEYNNFHEVSVMPFGIHNVGLLM